MNIWLLVLVTLLGVILGKTISLKKDSFFSIKYLTIFSGALLLGVVFKEMLPMVYRSKNEYLILFLIIGLLFQLILELNTKGLEHGHGHRWDKLSISTVIALFIHSFFDGLPLSDHHLHHHLIWPMLAHKFIVGYVVSEIVFSSSVKKLTAYLLLSIFVISTPLGYFAGSYIPLFIEYADLLIAISSGAFIYVAFAIIFESFDKHQLDWKSLLWIMSGLGMIYVINF